MSVQIGRPPVYLPAHRYLLLSLRPRTYLATPAAAGGHFKAGTHPSTAELTPAPSMAQLLHGVDGVGRAGGSGEAGAAGGPQAAAPAAAMHNTMRATGISGSRAQPGVLACVCVCLGGGMHVWVCHVSSVTAPNQGFTGVHKLLFCCFALKVLRLMRTEVKQFSLTVLEVLLLLSGPNVKDN